MKMSHEDAVALVQRIMDADYDSDDEVGDLLVELGRSLRCPTGYVSDLIFWPKGPELSAEEVVDQAMAYRPFAL